MIEIITTIMPICIVTAIAVAIALLFNKPFYVAVPMATFSLIAVLYCFYITGSSIAFLTYLLPVLSVVLLLSSYIYIYRRKAFLSVYSKETFNVDFSSFCLYACLVLICLFLCRGKKVWLWDELRLWGAYPKALFYDPVLQLGENSYIYRIMKSYRPAMPLFAWFFSAFSSIYEERSVFLAYSFFSVCMMLPLAKASRRLFDSGFFIALVSITLVPALFYYVDARDYASYYGTLFIDGRLGICFGYAIYLSSKANASKFSLLEFLLSIFVLSQLKDSGVFLAFCCLCSWAIVLFREKNEIKTVAVHVLTGGAVVAFSYYSWSFLLGEYGINNHLSMSLSGDLVYCFLKSIHKTMMSEIFMFDLIGIRMVLKTWLLLVLIAVLKLILYRKHPHIKKTQIVKDICLIIGTVIFMIGYSSTFLSSIQAGGFPSLERYFSTILLAIVFDFILLCSDLYYDNKANYTKKIETKREQVVWLVRGAIITCLMLIILFPKIQHSRTIDYHIGQGEGIKEALLNAAEIKDNDKLINCFFCTTGDEAADSMGHHRAYYELIGSGVRIKNFYSESNILPSYSNFTSASEFLQYLKDNDYELFYMYHKDIDEEFNTIYGELFEGGQVKGNTTYLLKDDKLCLTQIQ